MSNHFSRAWIPMLGAAAVAAGMAALPLQDKSAPTNVPRIVDTRTIDVTQMVTLKDVPAGTKHVRMWIPIPSDGPWQRVLDRRVVMASGEWKLERLPNGRGEFIVLDIKEPKTEPLGAAVQCIVETHGVASALNAPAGPADPGLFKEALDKQSPLMSVDGRIQKMADDACGKERDPVRQARKLMQLVANKYDDYSKDASKPKRTRGSVEECVANGGGSCADLHSMFIALARARGIPARIQYGYRTLDSNVGVPYDSEYRCWAEFFVPGAGWIPTDIVAADGAAVGGKLQLGTLSATRVWLWEGRSFDLVPAAQAGPIHTMTCAWAEVDGKPVDVLMSADGSKPSSLTRTVQFKVMDRSKEPGAPRVAGIAMEPSTHPSPVRSIDPRSITRPDPVLQTYYIIVSLFTGPGIIVALPLLMFKYMTLRYRFDDEGIAMSWGVLFRRETYLTYRRIQDIHVTRGIIQRWLGIATISVQTASAGSGADMQIEGITQYDALRDFLYRRMRGAHGEGQETAGAGGAGGSDEALALLREIRDELRKVKPAPGGAGGGA